MLVLKVLLLCKQPRGNISAGLFAYINESITKRSVDSKLKFKEAGAVKSYAQISLQTLAE